MTQKWNLQDIRPVDKGNKQPASRQEPRMKQDMTQPKRRHGGAAQKTSVDSGVASVDIVDTRSSRKKRIIIASVVAIAIIGFGFLISALMSGADVTVYPKQKNVTVQASFTAYTDPQVGDLSYELVTLEADGERQVSATGEELVSERATGNILIYNAFSKSTQRLIKNTRFESPDGLIYRINESVEVPGMTVDESGEIAPGVITAEVFADGTGEQYNISPSKFTIPGLSGTEQFDSMHAESNDVFVGGFEGSKFIINDDELQTAKQALHLELRDALLARIEKERPAGFVLFEDAVTFVFDSLPSTEYGDELVTIKERARLQVPVFNMSEFATYIAENTVSGFEDAPVLLPDPFTLTFSYTSATSAISDISSETSVEFDLTGQTQIVWDFDKESLQNDLVGLSKTALPSVLSGYPAITRAEAVIRPFWKRAFPDNASGIEIIEGTLE